MIVNFSYYIIMYFDYIMIESGMVDVYESFTGSIYD